MFMHYMDFMSGCLLFIMVFDLESACRSKVENGTIHTAVGIKKERGIKGARKWNQRNMVSEQLQNNISKHIGSHKFPPTPPLTSIEGKGSQNSVQPIRKMKKVKLLELYSSIRDSSTKSGKKASKLVNPLILITVPFLASWTLKWFKQARLDRGERSCLVGRRPEFIPSHQSAVCAWASQYILWFLDRRTALSRITKPQEGEWTQPWAPHMLAGSILEYFTE